MKSLIQNILFISVMVLGVSCQKTEIEVSDENVKIFVEISEEELTRVNEDGSSFVSGDKVQVENTSRLTNNSATFTFDGSQWTTSDVILWDGQSENTFQAWHPADASFESFVIPADQSEGLDYSDWMTASATAKISDGGVKLKFKRHLTKVTVAIVGWGDEYDQTAKSIERLDMISLSGVMSNTDGTVTGDGNILPVQTYAAKPNESLIAIIAPGSYEAGVEFMKVYINGNEDPLTVTTSQPFTLKPSMAYKLQLKIGKNSLTIASDDVTVKPWTDETLDDCVGELVKKELTAVNNEIDVTFAAASHVVQIKSTVNYDILIPDGVSWIRYTKTESEKYDNVYFRISGNTSMQPRSATILFQQTDGDLSTAVTISQDYFTGFDDSDVSGDKYLTYVSNTEQSEWGDAFDYNYYTESTYFKARLYSNSVCLAEYKFKMPSESNVKWPISDDYVMLEKSKIVVYEYREDGDNYYNDFNYGDLGVNYTDVITLQVNSADDYLVINGKRLEGTIRSAMGNYIFSQYYRYSDDGVDEGYKGFMDGARLYYAKGWDEYGRLIYLGYPSTSLNAKTGNVEACWVSKSFTDSVWEEIFFAKYVSSGYQPLGMGNL